MDTLPLLPLSKRRSIRLPGYDYCWVGAYFVTIVTADRKHILGHIHEGTMFSSAFGAVAQECWDRLPGHFAKVKCDAFVVMPNHVHGVVGIWDTERARHASPLLDSERTNGELVGPESRSLGAIIGSYKAAVTKGINELRGRSGEPVWQRNYCEHIVRNEDDLNRIRQYISENPLQWEKDPEYV